MTTELKKNTTQELKQPSTNPQGDLSFSLPIYVTRNDHDVQSIMNLWDITELTPSSLQKK